jgi:BASS family bile acid:Na+ symporter
MLERFLLLWLISLSTLAYCWVVWLPAAWNPFDATAPGLNYLFAVTMLAIGSLLPRDEVRQVAMRWPLVLVGTALQYTAMPLLAYGLARLFALEGAWMAGVVLVGCVPGAMASNVLTLVSRGNVSYSVSLTTSATLLSPLVVPFALWLALRHQVDFPVGQTMWTLCWMVVFPVVLGYLLSRRLAVWQAAARRLGAVIANLAILWIIAVVVAGAADKLAHVEGRLLLALLGLNLGGYLVGAVGGSLLRLSGPMRRALTLEIGMQNAGLGATLAVELFGPKCPEAIAPAIYTFGCMLTGTVLARLWAEFGGPKEDRG